MLRKLPFRLLNALSPGVAAVAFVVMLVVVPTLGAQNQGHLERIRDVHVPALQASREMEVLLGDMHRTFAEATQSGDPAALQRADRQRKELEGHLRTLKRGKRRTAEELKSLAESLHSYYKEARGTTAKVIAGGLDAETVASLERQEAQYKSIRDMLARGTADDQKAMAVGFSSAEATNRSAVSIIMTAAIISVCVLVALAFVVGRVMRSLVEEIVGMSAQISSASTEMSATANQHEQGASEQVSAVEETRRTMNSLVATGEQVNRAIDVVLRNAEQTQSKNQLIADSIARLSEHTEGIAEILEATRGIAHKSDLLALNAALEGTKAGEAGRGFSLVASQMQRLAESVMDSVVNIKALTGDIRKASGSSVLATEEGTKLAFETTRSAREIRMIVQQYQAGTNQVSQAMDDISQVGQQAALGSRQVLAGSKDLAFLSEKLLGAVSQFRLHSKTEV